MDAYLDTCVSKLGAFVFQVPQDDTSTLKPYQQLHTHTDTDTHTYIQTYRRSDTQTDGQPHPADSIIHSLAEHLCSRS